MTWWRWTDGGDVLCAPLPSWIENNTGALRERIKTCNVASPNKTSNAYSEYSQGRMDYDPTQCMIRRRESRCDHLFLSCFRPTGTCPAPSVPRIPLHTGLKGDVCSRILRLMSLARRYRVASNAETKLYDCSVDH